MYVADILKEKGGAVFKTFPTDSVLTAIRKLADYRIGALLVEDQWMKPVGIFSERDFVNAVAKRGAPVINFAVSELMSSPVISCRSMDRIDAVLATMTKRKIRHLPVIDDGTLHGMISIGDLVKYRLTEKELEANVLLEIARMRA